MIKENVFKRSFQLNYYIKRIVISIILGIIITLLLSLALGYRYRVVATDSMSPNIPQGSLVIESKVTYEELKVDDVITYRRMDEQSVTVTHRIIDIENNNLIVKGDNPEHEQIDVVTKDLYVGKVILTIPNIRAFFDWIYANMFLLLYDLVVIIVVYQICF